MNDGLYMLPPALREDIKLQSATWAFFAQFPSVLSVTIYCLRDEEETEIIIVSLKVCAAAFFK